MSDDLPKKFRIWPRLIIYPLILALVVLMVPDIGQRHFKERARKAEAKTATTALVSALKAYHTEYGKWPDFTGGGLFLDEKRQAQLLRTLHGEDEANNPRTIMFFEAKTASKVSDSDHRYRSGFSPETGAFFDPWGNLYHIILDSDGDGKITDPYADDTEDSPIRTSVIAWSLGKDGKQGSPANPHTSKGSDDVTSWQ